MSTRKEYGDFQTSDALAAKVAALVDTLFPLPEFVIEPTAGLGAFLRAAHAQWGEAAVYRGYEINPEYVRQAAAEFTTRGVEFFQRDFFEADWKETLCVAGKPRVLVVGNPPWVTNSGLGLLGSGNLPQKTNFQRLNGLAAKTGKANFDIAEWMLIRLIEALPETGALAMLCKTMTARKVLRHFWKNNKGRDESRLFRIDAAKEFSVAVDACLFYVTGKHSTDRTAVIYEYLDVTSAQSRFGFVDGDLVADIDSYQRHKMLDGGSFYTWRSGVKHDAASVMELDFTENGYENGLGEKVEIEEDYVYPLLKSSDLGNSRTSPRKHVLITQKKTSEDTAEIKKRAPKTWEYLLKHANALDGRKSSIYTSRPRFSIFGIGDYAFSQWKVAISGLYKSLSFVVVPPCHGRPVMVDDTCYAIPCGSEKEAKLVCELLNSGLCQSFLKSLVFPDSKRPVTIDILRRISLVSLAGMLGKSTELRKCAHEGSITTTRQHASSQMDLFMEEERPYHSRATSLALPGS